MKKSNLKLKLNKETISRFELSAVNGGDDRAFDTFTHGNTNSPTCATQTPTCTKGGTEGFTDNCYTGGCGEGQVTGPDTNKTMQACAENEPSVDFRC
ncbi:hypothetical protein T190115A13A_180036 [Tenacibaculum sp. 190524A02b]|uniref:Uncharacterized protein n=1 Tax=Tenacibaculum vairaonense TaxID=3137860 RepID=A0ABP1F8Z9_9FLAO